MATHKSAEKRARQSERRADRNSQTKSAVRTFEKKVRASVAAGDTKSAADMMSEFQSRMGKAAAKGVFHGKSAARKIGRLAAAIHKASKGAPAPASKRA